MELIRSPVVAGQFYPSNPVSLKSSIQQYLQEAHPPDFASRVRGIIVPHAGYIYSGRTAAYAYKLLEGSTFERIILVGPSHYKLVEQPVTDNHQVWSTPLGDVHLFNSNFSTDQEAHRHEHALEVQVPFLQVLMNTFEILPILISDTRDTIKLAADIDQFADETTLLLFSTDLSHYFPHTLATQKDARTLQALTGLDIKEFEKSGDACGKAAVVTAMLLARNHHWKIDQLFYENSGNRSGDFSSVVGYSSLLLTESI